MVLNCLTCTNVLENYRNRDGSRTKIFKSSSINVLGPMLCTVNITLGIICRSNRLVILTEPRLKNPSIYCSKTSIDIAPFDLNEFVELKKNDCCRKK